MYEWMDGWMDMTYSFEVIAFVSRIIPISFFLRHGYPLFLSLFFLGHASLACHLFSIWGNHNLRHGALIMWNEWVVVPIPSVGM